MWFFSAIFYYDSELKSYILNKTMLNNLPVCECDVSTTFFFILKYYKPNIAMKNHVKIISS